MATYRTPCLTPADIRNIGNQAVADVASKKITTSKAGAIVTSKTGSSIPSNAAKAENIHAKASQVLNNPNASAIQKSLAGSALTQAQGRGYFKDAFNKARKG